MTGMFVLALALVVALAVGAYRLVVDGRFRRGRRPVRPTTSNPTLKEIPGDLLAAAMPETRLGERATLLQFSSAFCAPCRATRRTLAEVAQLVPGVTHLEVDAEAHLDLVRQLRVQRTPTTLVLDAAGHEVTRAAGAPRKEQVLGALATACGSSGQ